MTLDRLERIVDQAAALPLGNQVALARVVAVCADPSSSARGVALEASRDEGFTALLLRLANSAHSASVHRVADLAAAVSRLGIGLVQSLAVAAPGLRLLTGPNDGLAASRRAIHRHAVRTGLVARVLAPRGVDPEEALAAGLLHNVGLGVLSLYEPEVFRQLVELASRGVQLGEPETELVGFTHADLGARLAERWSYPLTLVEAIADHDAPEPRSRLAAAVKAGDLLVRATGVGLEPPQELDPGTLQLTGLAMGGLADRVGPLLEAQARLDERMEAEGLGAPGANTPAFAEALEYLV